MIIDNWQLLPTINLLASKIRSLNGVFSSQLGLKQPSLSASYLQECVNKGRGQRFEGMAKIFTRTIDLAPPSFKSWIHHCCEYMDLLHATYAAMFHHTCCNSYYRRSGYILAHICMTTQARDFKFAGAIVQRL